MRRVPGRRAVMAMLVALTALGLLTGCASARAGADRAGVVDVVASTDVYGDLVQTIAGAQNGRAVQVTSIIDNPSADPHSYEANARNQLAISRADLVLENGGGYDTFIGRMRHAANSHAAVLDAVAISGKHAVNGELNEHVWYDFPTVAKIVDRIASDLAARDTRHAAAYRANAAALQRGLRELQAREAAIAATSRGVGVAITEPVPLYLLTACGLVNRTPSAFSEAIEEDRDVAPSVLDQTRQLFRAHEVRLLAYNEQTSSSQTQAVFATAKSSGVAVVPVAETLPAGEHYLSWMRATLDRVQAALR